MDQSDIPKRVGAYFSKVSAEANHRYRSWEHCYRFFRAPRKDIRSELDVAALQLGFYLASWGMYRGSSFLLQRDYTVHKRTIEALTSERFAGLWELEIGADPTDEKYTDLILQTASAVRSSYEQFGNATDVLVTKVLLGTLGCLPACDRLFIEGFKRTGHSYSKVNARFVGRMVGFCTQYAAELRQEQSRIALESGANYPLMKLADMYFWQIGFEALGEPAEAEA